MRALLLLLGNLKPLLCMCSSEVLVADVHYSSHVVLAVLFTANFSVSSRDLGTETRKSLQYFEVGSVVPYETFSTNTATSILRPICTKRKYMSYRAE